MIHTPLLLNLRKRRENGEDGVKRGPEELKGLLDCFLILLTRYPEVKLGSKCVLSFHFSLTKVVFDRIDRSLLINRAQIKTTTDQRLPESGT